MTGTIVPSGFRLFALRGSRLHVVVKLPQSSAVAATLPRRAMPRNSQRLRHGTSRCRKAGRMCTRGRENPPIFAGTPGAAQSLALKGVSPMLELLQTLIFALALGFVISGVVSNLFGLVTDGASIFHFPVTSDARRLAIVGLLIFAGPHILFRAARRALKIGDWPPAYTFSCFGLCSVWSFVVGYAVLRLFVVW